MYTFHQASLYSREAPGYQEVTAVPLLCIWAS